MNDTPAETTPAEEALDRLFQQAYSTAGNQAGRESARADYELVLGALGEDAL